MSEQDRGKKNPHWNINGKKRSTFDSVGKRDCNSSEGHIASDVTNTMAHRHWKEQLQEIGIDRLQNKMAQKDVFP